MHWLEIHIDTVPEGLDPLCALLSALGIDNVAVEDETEFREFLEENRPRWDYVDAQLEASMRGRSRVTFYLPEDEEGFGRLGEVRVALQRLKEERQDCGALLMTLDTVEDADWANNWKQYYKPLEIGQRLLIVPEWETAEAGNRVPVILDPGVAFGTGGHDTTRLCLTLLDERLKGGERVLDLGCGSGILSIAAVKLGAASATAVDIDRVSARAAQANAARNGLDESRCTVLTGDVLEDADLRRQIGGGDNIVLANIVADVILRLAPDMRDFLVPGGLFLCSGVIDSRAEETAEGLRKSGFTLLETRASGGWYAFACEGPKTWT